MSSVLVLLNTFVVNATWQIAVWGAAAWILSRLLGRIGPQLQHRIWVTTLLLALLAPTTPLLRTAFESRLPAASGQAPDSMAVQPAAGGIMLTGAQISMPAHVMYCVAGLYVIVFIILAVRLAAMIRSTYVLVRNSTPLRTDSERGLLWDRARRAFGVQRAVLACTDQAPGPVTASLPHPTVLLPATQAGDFSQTEFLAAVGHECAHIQRHDFWKNLAYEAAGVVIGFHPMTWLIKSQIAQTRELICDGLTAERLLDRHTYAISLLELARTFPKHAAAATSHTMGIFDSDSLERRIMNLKATRPASGRTTRFAGAAAAILALCGCAGLIGSAAQPVTAQTAVSAGQAHETAKDDKQRQPRKDLSCTYWSPDDKAHPGTCGVDKKDKSVYRCYSNADPALSNIQVACESKLRSR